MRAIVIGSWLVASGCQVLFPLDEVAAGDSGSEDVASSDCPAGYIDTGSGVYRASATEDRKSWFQANTACIGDGVGFERKTHLVVLRNNQERNLMIAGLALTPETDWWIGLFDDTPLSPQHVFQWTTNETIQPPYPVADGIDPWSLGEPNGSGNAEDCVRISPESGLFNDVVCSDLLPYVCECDEFPSR